MSKKNHTRERLSRSSTINDENRSSAESKEELENGAKSVEDNEYNEKKRRKKDSKSGSSTKSKRKKNEANEVGETEGNNGLDGIKPKKRKTEIESSTGDAIEKDLDMKDSDASNDAVKQENEKEAGEIPENLKLTSYRISQETIDCLKKRGIMSLFPIQASTFDLIYDGKDVLARAKTGTGKTLAFALPITEILLELQKDDRSFYSRGRPPKVIIMTPTRDLAKQVSAEFESIAPNLKVLCIYGGVAYDLQNQGLREGIDVLVGTPGRIMDHIDRGNLKLVNIKFVVLDEADQMLDIGFAEAMETVLKHIRQHKEDQGRGIDYQTLLFSATVPDWVRQAIKNYLRTNYENVDLIINTDTKTNVIMEFALDGIPEEILLVTLLHATLAQDPVLFFVILKMMQMLALNDKLKQDAQVLHGDIAQTQREITMKRFREGKFKCIICTDVLARGIDIPQVDLVINCEPPKDIETYVHRAGRTARAGRQGTAVTFFKPQEEYLLLNIQRRTGIVFQMVGPPQPQEIIAATANDVIKNIESVESTVVSYFHETAKELIASQGAVEALSAALAYMSGYAGGIKKRSLMSAVEGYTTLLFRFTYPIRHSSYVRNIFKNHYPQLSEDSIKAFKLTKDMQGVVCDISSDKLEIGKDGEIILAGKPWANSKTTTLEIAKELPELQEVSRWNHGDGGGNTNGGGYRSGNRNSNKFGNNRNGNGYGGSGRGSSRGYGRKNF
ncbi:13267_t:CDS:2 [Acaulospora morrowiae]|uniref:RNA helicase n=1 Tax=Acaulospora morrowiae TaxID=94023 RepID=A0A9N9CY34_9GLOM|nr:13267_t:CDS:2 [Acaulospora morrowiae]